MKASELIKLLKKHGFRFDRQEKGSHEIWANDQTGRKQSFQIVTQNKEKSK